MTSAIREREREREGEGEGGRGGTHKLKPMTMQRPYLDPDSNKLCNKEYYESYENVNTDYISDDIWELLTIVDICFLRKESVFLTSLLEYNCFTMVC